MPCNANSNKNITVLVIRMYRAGSAAHPMYYYTLHSAVLSFYYDHSRGRYKAQSVPYNKDMIYKKKKNKTYMGHPQVSPPPVIHGVSAQPSHSTGSSYSSTRSSSPTSREIHAPVPGTTRPSAHPVRAPRPLLQLVISRLRLEAHPFPH